MSKPPTSIPNPPPSTTASDGMLDQSSPGIARIKTHMTADHANSLHLFLQHYAQLPTSSLPPYPPPPNTLELDAFHLTHFTITHPSGRNYIPFTPPLASPSQARERLVEMHQTCLKALDLSDTQINTYRLPSRPWMVAFNLFIILIWITYSPLYRPYLAPNPLTGKPDNWVNTIWSVNGLVPGLAKLASLLARPTLWFMLVVHTAETVYFVRGRARKYGLKGWQWWAWTATVWNGGFAGFMWFDETVKDVEAKGKKH